MHISKTIKWISTTTIVIAVFFLSSCDQQTSTVDPITENEALNFSKPGKTEPQLYTEYAEREFSFLEAHNYYQSGNLNVPGGTTFSIATGSITPPSDIPWGSPVTLTMLVEFDEVNNKMFFTFGPHGTNFSPSAEVWLDFSMMNTSNVNLYYLPEKGKPQLQQPVEMQGQRMKLYIDHFSRYAIGTE